MRSLNRYFPSANQPSSSSEYSRGQDGVRNPYSVHLHNWRGGPLNEGNLSHGPNYNEPMATLPTLARPLWGMGAVDVDTSNGVFGGEGYGGGIFSGTSGVDSLGDATPVQPFVVKPEEVPVWGIPSASMIAVQTKINAVLVGAGKSPIRNDGVLDTSFCSAMSGMSDPQRAQLSSLLTEAEADIVYLSLFQCDQSKGINPASLPCWFPTTTNSSCGTQPQATCPKGQMLNALTGQCELVSPPLPSPLPVPPSGVTCPSGQMLNPLTQQCQAIPQVCPAGQVFNTTTLQCELGPAPTPSPLPTPPSVLICPSGQALNPLTGKCVALPTAVCPSGSKLNTTTGKCEVVPGVLLTCPSGQVYDEKTKTCVSSITPSTSSSSTPLLVAGGVVVFGLVAILLLSKKK